MAEQNNGRVWSNVSMTQIVLKRRNIDQRLNRLNDRVWSNVSMAQVVLDER